MNISAVKETCNMANKLSSKALRLVKKIHCLISAII